MILYDGSAPFVDPFMCGIKGYGGRRQKNIFQTIFCQFYLQMAQRINMSDCEGVGHLG